MPCMDLKTFGMDNTFESWVDSSDVFTTDWVSTLPRLNEINASFGKVHWLYPLGATEYTDRHTTLYAVDNSSIGINVR